MSASHNWDWFRGALKMHVWFSEKGLLALELWETKIQILR